jgi:S1-C subfamily serine protease
MRPSALIAIVAVAAALGGVVGVLVADRAGLVGGETTVSEVAAPTPTPAAPAAATAPTKAGFDPEAIYAKRQGGVVTIYADLGQDGQSQGSGFVVNRNGAILTNAHVVTNVASSTDVRGANAVFVEYSDGERAPAEIVGWDLFNDIGVIRVDPADHAVQPVPLGDSASAVVGEPVAAIGSPFGNQTSLSVGVVSATGRSISSLTSRFAVADAIQIDAPINKGNSGGPLFDAEGRVIGINAQIRSNSGNAEGVGFAIPINVAKRALEQLVRDGKVAYAYIGITTQDVTPGLARRFGLGADRGALVVDVEPQTPAARAGVKAGSQSESYNGLQVTLGGDVIVAIAGRPVRSAEDVSRIVTDELQPGQKVPFDVLRDGEKPVTVQVTLGERPLEPSS